MGPLRLSVHIAKHLNQFARILANIGDVSSWVNMSLDSALKNTDVAHYNFDVDQPILIMFGT